MRVTVIGYKTFIAHVRVSNIITYRIFRSISCTEYKLHPCFRSVIRGFVLALLMRTSATLRHEVLSFSYDRRVFQRIQLL